MTQLIILGWDALDIELIEKYGLVNEFGTNQTKIETHVNPQIDEPHTRELWPSIITGLHPDEHEIHAVSESGGVEWANSTVNKISTVANGIVPQPILDSIGRRMRESGMGLDQKKVDYYNENNLDTIFGPNRRAISIPNYKTNYDAKNGLDASRDDVWAELLVDRDGANGFVPDTSLESMYDILFSEVGKRLGHTISSYNQGRKLTFVWFGLLDTVGHMNPAVNVPLQKNAYHLAAHVTQTVCDTVNDNTVVVSLSDHGLQDGNHTHYATISSNDSYPIESIHSIFDVKPWIESLPLDNNQADDLIDGEIMESVKDQLVGLGYIE